MLITINVLCNKRKKINKVIIINIPKHRLWVGTIMPFRSIIFIKAPLEDQIFFTHAYSRLISAMDNEDLTYFFFILFSESCNIIRSRGSRVK